MVSNESDTPVSIQLDDTDGATDPKTLEVVLDLAKTTLERQASYARALDTKMVQVFQAASVVIGLAGLSSGGVLQWWPAGILLIGALIFYVLTARTAFYHLRPKPFWDVKPDTFWQQCWHLKPEDAYHSAIDTITESYDLNESTLEEKAEYIHMAIKTTGIEVALVGAAFVLAWLGSHSFWGSLWAWLSSLI